MTRGEIAGAPEDETGEQTRKIIRERPMRMTRRKREREREREEGKYAEDR